MNKPSFLQVRPTVLERLLQDGTGEAKLDRQIALRLRWARSRRAPRRHATALQRAGSDRHAARRRAGSAPRGKERREKIKDLFAYTFSPRLTSSLSFFLSGVPLLLLCRFCFFFRRRRRHCRCRRRHCRCRPSQRRVSQTDPSAFAAASAASAFAPNVAPSSSSSSSSSASALFDGESLAFCFSYCKAGLEHPGSPSLRAASVAMLKVLLPRRTSSATGARRRRRCCRHWRFLEQIHGGT